MDNDKFITSKIGFGGGCHWCTEAVFQSLKGVRKVEQGWIASSGLNDSLSEAIIVHFDDRIITMPVLVAIHLYTHSCTSQHSMRKKYRSAAYSFSENQADELHKIIEDLQKEFDKPIVTQVLPFIDFKENEEQYQNYYLKNAGNQFCQTYINPKLELLMQQFSKHIDKEKLKE